MLDARLGAPDQAGRAVLQIGQAAQIGGIRPERRRIVARQGRIALARHQPAHRRIQARDFVVRGFAGPLPQHGQRGLGLVAAGFAVDLGGVKVHVWALSVASDASRRVAPFGERDPCDAVKICGRAVPASAHTLCYAT